MTGINDGYLELQEDVKSPTQTTASAGQGYIVQNRWWVQFVPALIVWPIWLFVMIRGDYWGQVFAYWPGTIGMAFGSFVAGSTPLGGGVVAFPLAVLIFKLTPAESRDVSVLVQTIGMNGAAYLLYISKRELLHAPSIIFNVVFGTIGILLALAHPASPYVVNLLYTLVVLEFAIVYFYTNQFVRSRKPGTASNQPPTAASLGSAPAASNMFMHVTMSISAVAGGILTGNMGSGSDIATYAYGIYIWNWLQPGKAESDNVFTASSVVVMGVLSAVVAIVRVLDGAIGENALFCWGSMVIVVVVGAPLGSLVLRPEFVPYLRALFYVMALMQFVMFAALKIKGDTATWVIVVVVTAGAVATLGLHWRSQPARQQRTAGG
jgi:uncharacterized membrane protein YfcA